MIRLSDFPGNPAGSGAVRWDQRSVDVLSVIHTARTLRAEYIADHLHSAAKAIGRWTGLSALFAAWRHRRQRRRTLKALTALDDRVLNDIGVDRAEIAATAALSCDQTPRSSNSVWHGLSAWAGREVNRRRTLRELSALTDEMLADIGISRAEIPAVVADLFAGQTQGAAGETVDITADIPVTAPVPAQVMAFMEVRRSLQRAANQNLNRPAA